MSSNYRRGVRFENRVKKHFEKHGWYVMRSAGSRGPADLIAMNPGSIWLIACRTEKARYSALEANKLWHLAWQLGRGGNVIKPYLVCRESTPPWRFLIEKIEQKVWDPAKGELPPWEEEQDANNAA